MVFVVDLIWGKLGYNMSMFFVVIKF